MTLSATGVSALREPGRYSDGNGLHLFIGSTGNRSWVQRVTIGGRRGISVWEATPPYP